MEPIKAVEESLGRPMRIVVPLGLSHSLLFPKESMVKSQSEMEGALDSLAKSAIHRIITEHGPIGGVMSTFRGGWDFAFLTSAQVSHHLPCAVTMPYPEYHKSLGVAQSVYAEWLLPKIKTISYHVDFPVDQFPEDRRAELMGERGLTLPTAEEVFASTLHWAHQAASKRGWEVVIASLTENHEGDHEQEVDQALVRLATSDMSVVSMNDEWLFLLKNLRHGSVPELETRRESSTMRIVETPHKKRDIRRRGPDRLEQDERFDSDGYPNPDYYEDDL